MSRWTRPALVGVVLAALLQFVTVLAASQASASCAPFNDTRLFWDADVVFAGTATGTNGDVSETVFDVDRVYKGDVGPTTIVVVPGLRNPGVVSSTTIDFGDAAQWLVFAHERRGGLVAVGCAGTRPLPTTIPAVLGTGYAPITHRWIRPEVEGELREQPGCRRTSATEKECLIVDYGEPAGSAPWLAAVGVALLVLAGLGLLWIRRVRRRRANLTDEAEEPYVRFRYDTD